MASETRTIVRFSSFPWIMLAFIAVALPLFFVPSLSVPFQFTKVALAALVAFGGLAFFAFGRLGKRSIAIPTHPIMIALAGIAIAYLLSTVFSANPAVTLLGERIASDSFGFIAIGCVLAFLAAVFLDRAREMMYVYMGILASAAILALIQLARILFGADTLTFGGVLAGASATPMGTIHDGAIFFGLIAVLSLVTLVTLPISRMVRIVVLGALVFSTLLLAVVNLVLVWVLVGVFALGTFVYSMMQGGLTLKLKRRKSDENEVTTTAPAPVSGVSLIILVIASFFVFGGDSFSRLIWSVIDIGQIDIRPSWQTTLEIGQASLAEHPIFGAGPGTFESQWALYRPPVMNQTIAWNTDFGSGIGFIPTSIISTGAIGLLAWIAFLVTFAITGYAALVARSEGDVLAEFLVLASYLGAAYLWIIALVSNPAPALLLYAFLLTGLFLASLRFRGRFPEVTIDFVSNPRRGFIAALALTVVFLGSVGTLFAVSQQYLSGLYLQKGIIAAGQRGDVEGATQFASASISFAETDRAYRLLTDLGVARLNRLAQTAQNPTDADRQLFQNELANTVNLARRATEIDPHDYANWLSLGSIYQSLVPLKIEGAYENAKSALTNASGYRPQSPSILLAQAYLERAAQNPGGARTFAEQALTLRPAYTEAIFLLAQLSVESDNLPEAIQRVSAATILEPQNPVVYFQLGLLEYANEDYVKAVQAFERAVSLNGSYANARYFLGLSLYRIDRVDDAISEFETVAQLNPGNTEVTTILNNLQAGRDPFTGLSGEGSIEERSSLPIESDNDSLDPESDAVIGEELAPEPEEPEPTNP